MKKKKKRKEVRQMQRALNSFLSLSSSTKSVNFTGFLIKLSFVSKGSKSNKRLEDLC